MKKPFIKMGLCLSLALGLIPTMPTIVEASKSCKTKEECNAIISEAQDQISEIKGRESKLQDEIEIVEGDMGTTVQKISQTESAISEFEKKISQKETEIKSGEEEAKRLDEEVEALKKVVAQRMHMSQRFSRGNLVLQMLSESNSLVDFIRQLRVINHFAQSDAQSMDELSLLVSQQQALLATLKVQQQELAESKDSLEKERETLDAYQQKLEQQKRDLAKQMQELESERLSASEIIEIAEEQKKILEQTPPPPVSSGNSSSNGSSSSGGVVMGSGFMIPLARGYVSCEFMCYSNHTGIDLANYGDTSTPVYAAQAGTVIRAGWHSAYGNHVMITHNINGKTMTTVYAHMHSAPYVSVGQQVARGTQLGTMGNTGNSFGAHLHFEMYEGYYNYPHAVNPRKYINFPSSW